MSDTSHYCVECERLAGELATLRAELEQERARAEELADAVGGYMRREQEQMIRAEDAEAELARVKCAYDRASSRYEKSQDELRRKRLGNKRLREERDELRAKLERVRPVVEAAVRLRDRPFETFVPVLVKQCDEAVAAAIQEDT